MKSLADCSLYAFVDLAYVPETSVRAVTLQLCDGGADMIQLRAKGMSADRLKRHAEAMLELTGRAGVGLVINDHFQLAQQIAAPCCHLGQEDFFDAGYQSVEQLRASGWPKQVGLSTHAPEQAQRALTAGADYIAIGPVYATGTKPGVRPVGLDYVRWASRHVDRPWFAIGGITLENLDEVLAAGATRVCVVSAILKAPDVAEACLRFKKRLRSQIL